MKICYRCRTNEAPLAVLVPMRDSHQLQALCSGCNIWVATWIDSHRRVGAPLLPGPYMVFDRQGV